MIVASGVLTVQVIEVTTVFLSKVHGNLSIDPEPSVRFKLNSLTPNVHFRFEADDSQKLNFHKDCRGTGMRWCQM
jgi:hypothetical protein